MTVHCQNGLKGHTPDREFALYKRKYIYIKYISRVRKALKTVIQTVVVTCSS